MKILYCDKCEDLVILSKKAKFCKCQAVGGAHINADTVAYHGQPVLMETPKGEFMIDIKRSQMTSKPIFTNLKILPKGSNEFIKVGDRNT